MYTINILNEKRPPKINVYRENYVELNEVLLKLIGYKSSLILVDKFYGILEPLIERLITSKIWYIVSNMNFLRRDHLRPTSSKLFLRYRKM